MTIRFKRLIACGLALAATLLGSMAFAAEVTPDMARTAMCNWRKSHGTFGMPVGKTVSEVRTVEKKGVRFHVVKMEGGGAILVPATTKKRPVIMLLEGDDFDENDENPLWDILVPDLGTAVAQPTLKTATPKAAAVPQKSIVEQQWDELLAEPLQFATGDTMSSAISDVRVDSLVKARWAQGYTETADGQWVRCYSYYTPLCPDEYEGGIRFIPSPSGCVATALGQIVRHFEYPASNVNLEPYSNPNCKSNKVAVTLTTVSRNFDWSKMPYDPAQYTASELSQNGYDQAIGGFLYDLGVYLGMSYKASGSGSNTSKADNVLLDRLGYSNASYRNGLQTDDETLKRIFVSNFNAKLPVQIGLSNHSIVGDGYGYNGDDVIWYHINYGWADSNTAWYQMPQYDSSGTEGLFRSAVYNIYTTRPASQVIVSGRVTKPDGTPFAGARVSVKASAAPATEVTSATTDEKGLYAVFVEKGEYALSVSEEGAGGICVSGSTVAAATDDIGNLAFCDIATAAGAEVALPANYTQLEYIQSTGLEWIDTGYEPGYRTVTTMEAIPVDVSYKCAFFGCWMESGSGFSYGMYLNGSKKLAATFKGTGIGDWKSNQKAPTAGATYKMMVDGPNHKSYYWKNGALDDTLSHDAVASGSSTSSMLIFATRVNNSAASIPSKIKFLSMQITEGGTTVRDFVPCRNEKGEAGLWDLVEGKFYGNEGTGKFLGSDDAAMLDYLQSSRSLSSVDTGYYAQPGTCIDLDLQLTAYYAEQRIFGMYGDNNDCMTMLLYTWSSDGNYRTRMGKHGTAANSNSGVKQDTNRHVHTLDGWNGKYYIDGGEKTAQGKNIPDGTLPANKTLWFFFPQGGANNDWPVMKLYGSQFYEWENGVKTLKHDWVPWRDAGGGIGLCDLSTETFKAQTGNALAWRLAYMQDAANPTVLKLHDGTLAAEHLTTAYMKRFASITAVEKVTYGELAAGAVTSYSTPLTLSKGVFSLADGAVKTVSVSGALAFKGGATLKIDATTSACDTFTVTSLDLTGATAANPFMIDISNEGAGTDWSSGETLTLVTGTGLADGICGNIRVTQSGAEELVAAVKDGCLIIRLKPAPRATWTGAAGNYDFTDPGNWEYFDEYDVKQDRAPDANTDVYFKGSDVPDITGSATFVAKSLILSAALDRDCDWSGLDATIPVSGKIDLKGNKLTVVGLPATWTAEITDSNPVEGYELLDSIANADASQNWIDTGVMATPTLRAEYDLRWDDAIAPINKFVCGNDVSYGACAYVYSTSAGTTAPYTFRTGTGQTTKVGTSTKTRRTIVIDMKNKKGLVYEADGTLHASGNLNPTASAARYSMYALSARTSSNDSTAPSNFGKQTFYGVKFYENDVLTHDFVPARRLSDGVLGLLDLANLSAVDAFKAKKGTGTLTEGAVTGALAAGGELHVNVASGKTVTGGATLTGSVMLVKDGEGTFTWGSGTAAATCPILVTNGVFRMGVTTADVFGSGGTITVKENGQYDLNQNGGTAPTINRTFHIEGDGPDGTGAIVNNNTSGTTGGQTLKTVYLTDDATIGGSRRIDFRGTADTCRLFGEGHVLTIKNTGMVAFCGGDSGCTVDRIVVADGGELQPCSDSTGTLDVEECIELKNGGKLISWHGTPSATYELKVPVVVSEGTGTVGTDQGSFALTDVEVGAGATLNNTAGAVNITGTLSGGGTVSGANIAFGGTDSCWTMAADNSDWTSKADLTDVNANALAALTAIDITYAGNDSKELEISPALGLTTTLPLLTVKTEDGSPIASTLKIEDGKLYVNINLEAVATATWTGTIDGDIKKPGNWDCKNALGWPVVDGLPGLGTTVTFAGDKVPSILTDSEFTAKDVVLSDASLSADCDWRGLTIPVSGKIDLKGNTLTVADLPSSWDVEITDSTTVYERLNYIEAKTEGPYIDTLYTLLEKDVVDLRADIPSRQNEFRRFFGARNGSGSDNRYEIGINNGGNAYPGTQNAICRYFRKSANDGKPATDTTFYDQPIDIHCDETCMKWGPAGTGQWTETIAVVNGLGGDCVVSCHVFGTNGSTSRARGRVYSLKITSGGTVVRDFVPVRRSDGVFGLLDLEHLGSTDAANPEFYANAGTGAFTAGAATGETYGPVGELHVNVANGETVENTTVTLSGSLKLVKDGAGTFVSMDATQTYVGGTDVLGGTVKLGGESYLGTDYAPITVCEGAILDIGAGKNRTRMRPVLAGGTLRNSEEDVGSDKEQNAVIVLTDDSSIDFTWNGGMIGSNYAPTTLDLGGKALDLTVASGKSFYLDNADVSAGTLKLSGGGTLAIDKTKLRAASADFDIASAVTVAVPAEVHDWIVREGATVSGNGTITVNGTYRPDGDTAAKYELKDGATLDLEGRSTALNAANLTFPDGGTVFIDLGTRKTKSSKPLISWEEGKGPANVTFKLSPNTVTRGFLEVRKDGLYIQYGMTLMLR